MQMRSENSSPIYDLYRIIGCSKNSTCDQILVEYRQKALLLHPDKIGNGVSEEEAKKNFQQLQFAKDILTNPQKRKHYDLWIDFGFFECSLEDWMNNQEKIKQTMHWGNQKEQKQLIGITNCNVKGNDSWISSSSPISRAFKDYKI